MTSGTWRLRDTPASATTSTTSRRPHHHPAFLVTSSSHRTDLPDLTVTRLGPHGGTDIAAERHNIPCDTPPDRLAVTLARLQTHELHVSDDTVAAHHRTILAVIRTVPTLRHIVLGTMAFDLADPLDTQLVRLVLVLSSHQPLPPPAR